MTTVNLKKPYVVLERLSLQDVAGLKLPRSPEYKTLCPSPSTKGTRDSNVKEGRTLSPSAKGTRDSSRTLSPSTKGTNDSSARESRTRSPSSRGTNDSSVKEGRWLKEQSEATNGENTAHEDGAQGATEDGESCRPAGEEGSKEHHCFRCSMNFPNSDTLVLHLKSHGPVRRSCTLYEKEVCGTSLDDSGPQNRRMMTSTSKQGDSSPRSEGSRFPCNVCDKVFMQTNHLKLHMRTHSESKTDKEQGTGSDENSPPLDTTAFIRMMKNVIQDTAIKCFTDALESNNLPSSSDEALERVRIHAHKALEQYTGLMDLNEQREDVLEQILQNLDDGSLDIKQEEDDYDYGNGGELDENVVPVNSHNESSNCQNSLQNHQANIKSNLGNESSVRVPAHTSASDELTKAYTVTDIFPHSVQNVIEPKKFTGVTRNAQESKKLSENVQNVFCTPHESSVPDTEKGITTQVSPSKKHTPVGSVPPRKPGQSNMDTAKTTEGGENTSLTTYETLMLRKSKKLFSCHICHKPFGLESHLKLHQQNVHGIKQSKHTAKDTDKKREKENKQQSYQRNIKRRSKVLNREQDRKLHLNAHQQEGLFNCTVCDKVFSEECILKRHLKSHSEGLLYNCTQCEKAYELNEDLVFHMSREHPVTKHSPENSNKTPISKSGSHTGIPLHACMKCNLQFPNGTALKSHLHTCPSAVLEKEKAVDCSDCSMKFPDDKSLEQHMKLNHSKLLLKCSRCDLKFPNGNALQSHMKHHSTRSPVSTHSKCSKCQLKFSTDALLERHMKRNHSMFQSSNQHICCKCGQKFNNQALLVRHIRLTHSPELEKAKKVLCCSTCGMKFSDGSSLHAHMKHHTSFVQKSAELYDAAMSQNEVPVKLSPDSKVKSVQSDKLQNISTSVDNTATTVQCSQLGGNEFQPYIMLHHVSELESQYSEVNLTQQSSAKNLQPSPKTQKNLLLVTKEIKSNPVPVAEKSQTSSHSTETDFECSKCNIRFIDIDSLQNHMKLNHTPSLPNPTMKEAKTSVISSKRTEIVYECSTCSSMFKSNASLQNHIKVQHSAVPESTNILKCLRCHKQFHTSSQFRSHLRTHRKKVCPLCGKLFTTQSSLTKHMCLHTGQLSYKCDTCSSQFSSSVLFQKHLEWHDADAHLAVENRGNIPKQIKTGGASQSVAPAESFQSVPYSSPKINNAKNFGNCDSENTSHEHLDEENLVTIDDDDDDIIILSDDENIVNTESHNSDELDEIDDEIMMILDDTNPNHFKESSSKQLSNRTPELSTGVQTDVVLSNKPATAFLTNNRNVINSNLNIGDGVGSFKSVPLDSFKLHGGVDHSSDMVGSEIANNSTVSSRKLPSSVGRCRSPDTSSVLSSINGSVSDSQDSVQLENDKIVKKSPKASPTSSNRKRVLKDTNQLVGPQQKKGKMLRVSFADDISDRASDTSICSEDVEKTMPKLLPQKMMIDSSKSVTPLNNVKHPSLLKNCSVSLTKLKEGMLGSNASKISTVNNKNASEELLKRRESTRNRISGGKKINDKDELQTFKESLKTDDHSLSLSAEAKNTKLGARSLLHYENVVNSSCEEDTGNVMNNSYPMATSTPLITNKLNHIRTTDSAVHSAKAENLSKNDGHSAEDMGSQNKLGLSHNVLPHHSENRNGKSASIEKEKLEHSKPSMYTRKKKHLRLKGGRFKCKVCGKVFQSLPHLRVHKKTHTGQLIHKCPICNDRFPLRFLLGLHVADHFEKGIPRMISENEMPSVNNSATSTSKNIAPTFHIPKKKTASTTKDSNAPTAAETSFSGVFSRSNSSATTIDGPTNQINSLAENQSLPSEISEDYSSTLPPFDHSNESIGNYSPDNQLHQFDDSFGYSPSSKRNKNLEFACEKCDIRFTQLLKLKMHQSIHTGIGLYKCSYCDLMFHFKPSFLSHVETHSGDKKFACKYCGRQFDEYTAMVRHRTHHRDGKRPFKCPDCPRTFALDSTLRAHMQLHIRRALYRCNFCNCSFGVKANFQHHIVVHTGKKPYICKVCKVTFNRVDACRKHVNLVHVAKNEITLESNQTLMDFVQIDLQIYKELQNFVQDILSKTRLGGEGKSESRSIEDSTIPIDKELPEPILVESMPLNDSFRKEICKAKANCTLSDIYSPDMNRKERYEKLCVEVRNVLTRMKRYSQIPIMSPSRNQSYLETPTRQIRDPRLKKSLNLSENQSPNNRAGTSKNKQETSGNLNNSADKKHSPKGSVIQKLPKSASLDKKYKKTVQVYKDVIAASKGKPCKYCGEVFGQRYMKTHELTHEVGGDILCSFCDKKFTTRTGLRYHLASHADVRPYPCAICGRAFKLKHQMYSHVRTHTSERNHKCKVCSKSFLSKGNLNIHILSHVPKENWPFKCRLCDQRFPTKYRLNYHTNRHSKVKPYECPVCYRKFSDKSSADRHVKTLHVGKNHLSTSIAQSDEPVTA